MTISTENALHQHVNSITTRQHTYQIFAYIPVFRCEEAQGQIKVASMSASPVDRNYQ
jgi:hypothetical protein